MWKISSIQKQWSQIRIFDFISIWLKSSKLHHTHNEVKADSVWEMLPIIQCRSKRPSIARIEIQQLKHTKLYFHCFTWLWNSHWREYEKRVCIGCVLMSHEPRQLRVVCETGLQARQSWVEFPAKTRDFSVTQMSTKVLTYPLCYAMHAGDSFSTH